MRRRYASTASLALANRALVLPLPDTYVKIVDLKRVSRVAVGKGELCIGSTIMIGIGTSRRRRHCTAQGDWGASCYTPVCRAHGRGRLFYIVQRKKDMIIVSGFKVYPTDCGGCAYRHPSVLEAAVIGCLMRIAANCERAALFSSPA